MKNTPSQPASPLGVGSACLVNELSPKWEQGVPQLCTSPWEQIREWTICCFMGSKWPNEIMRPHKGLNYVRGLCCSLGSVPAVRRPGRPKAKRGDNHPVCEQPWALSLHCNSPGAQAPQPTGQLLDQGISMALRMCLESLSALFGAQGSPVNNINSRPMLGKSKALFCFQITDSVNFIRHAYTVIF